MSSAKTRARIAKLRALADRPGTPAEGATARRLAEELAAKLPEEPAPRPAPSAFKFSNLPRDPWWWMRTGVQIVIILDEFGRVAKATTKPDDGR